MSRITRENFSAKSMIHPVLPAFRGVGEITVDPSGSAPPGNSTGNPRPTSHRGADQRPGGSVARYSGDRGGRSGRDARSEVRHYARSFQPNHPSRRVLQGRGACARLSNFAPSKPVSNSPAPERSKRGAGSNIGADLTRQKLAVARAREEHTVVDHNLAAQNGHARPGGDFVAVPGSVVGLVQEI